MAKKGSAPPASWDGQKPFPLHHNRLLKEMMGDAVKHWSDVVFVTSDGKTFTAQFCMISARWPYMLTYVIERRAKESGASSANWKSMHKPTQVESPFPAAVFSIILKYVYSDKINPEKLKIPEAVELAVAASHYKLDRLRSILEHHLVSKLDETTIFTMLKAASEKNQLTIKAICLDYASRNFQAFVTNKQGVSLLGIELFQEVTLILSAQQAATERPPPISLPPTPPSTLTEDMMRLYSSMGLSDGVILIGNDKLRFHRPILAVQSPGITRWMDEKRETIGTGVELPGQLQPSSFKAFLRYAYYGDHKVPPEAAADLLRWFVKEFNLNEFKAVCEYCVQATVNDRSALESLFLAYSNDYQGREDMLRLKEQSLGQIALHLGSVDLKALANAPPPTSPPGGSSPRSVVSEAQRNHVITCDVLIAYQARLRQQGRRGATPAPSPRKPTSPPVNFTFKKPDSQDRVTDLRIGTKFDRSDDASAGSAGRRVIGGNRAAAAPAAAPPASPAPAAEAVPVPPPRGAPAASSAVPSSPHEVPLPSPPAERAAMPTPSSPPSTAIGAAPAAAATPNNVSSSNSTGKVSTPNTATPSKGVPKEASSGSPVPVSPRSSSHISSSAKLRRDQMLSQLAGAESPSAERKEKKGSGKGIKKSRSEHDKLDKAGDTINQSAHHGSHHNKSTKPSHGSHHGSHTKSSTPQKGSGTRSMKHNEVHKP